MAITLLTMGSADDVAQILTSLTSSQSIASLPHLSIFSTKYGAKEIVIESSLSLTPSSSSPSSSLATPAIIGIAVGGVALAALVVLAVFVYLRRIKPKSSESRAMAYSNPAFTGADETELAQLPSNDAQLRGNRLAALPSPPTRSLPPPPATVKYKDMFICSITQDVMSDPVFAADGFTYERVAIETWLKNHNTSPNTNQPLLHKNLVPNHNLRSMILEWKQKNESRIARLESIRAKAKAEAEARARREGA